MKITKQVLKQVIKEELQKISEEGPLDRVNKAKGLIDNLIPEDEKERNSFINDLILHLKAKLPEQKAAADLQRAAAIKKGLPTRPYTP